MATILLLADDTNQFDIVHHRLHYTGRLNNLTIPSQVVHRQTHSPAMT
jgi:hypothetical protein